ncbi:MAG: hypothetical protein KBA75_01720 [Alphaproteobacteria bacterium]|nr:hypothetical protein [Alphaproteobacteria bacterium]
MMLLGWVNLVSLLLVGIPLLRRWSVSRLEIPILLIVFIWLACILTGHTLSLFTALDSKFFTCLLSVLWLAASLQAFRWVAGRGDTPQALCPTAPLNFPRFSNPKHERVLTFGLLILLGLAAGCSFLLVANNMPGNADSVSYRLPRAFWYVSHGSLLHPFDAIDRRTIFYPLNGTLLYTPLVVYGLPGTFHNFPTYIAWLIVTLVCYRSGRELGAPRSLSLLAATLAMLTPNILVQAAATNDEILSGGALLVGLYCLLRWARSGDRVYFLLAATLAGISIGTKLHIVFTLPIIALALLLFIVALVHHRAIALRTFQQLGWPTLTTSLTLALLMTVPFLLYNYLSTGRFYFTNEFAGDFFNIHGKLQVIGQNFLIYCAQLFFAPIGDLYGSADHTAREAFHATLNGFFKPLIAPHLSSDAADYHLQYRFNGITLMVSPYYLEYSLWAGFSFLLAPLLWQQAWRQRRTALGYPLLLLALTPVLWFVTWCITTLYMEGTPTYLAYYLVIAAPALLLLMQPIQRRWLSNLRWGLIALVLITHCIIDFNTYRFNEFRKIPRLFESARLPYDWELMDESIVTEIKSAPKIQIAFTRWGMSNFGIMQHNPHAFYYGPNDDARDEAQTLTIFSIPSAQYWGFAPIHMPHKPHPGATFIGKMRGWGPEAVFATGHDVARRWPDRNRYVIFQARTAPSPAGLKLMLIPYTPGYHDPDSLEIRYEVWRGQKLELTRDWAPQAHWETLLPASPAGAPSPLIKIQLRLPGTAEPDVEYDLDLSTVREWTDTMIGVTPWVGEKE